MKDGKLSVPFMNGAAANETFKIVVQGVSNPNKGAISGLDIVTKDSNGNIIQYTSDAATFTTVDGPKNIVLSKLTTTSNSLSTKSDYEICAKLKGVIPADA